MLVLTYKPGESLTISHAGEVIELKIMDVLDTGRVKVGFSGPRTFAVARQGKARPLRRDE